MKIVSYASEFCLALEVQIPSRKATKRSAPQRSGPFSLRVPYFATQFSRLRSCGRHHDQVELALPSTTFPALASALATPIRLLPPSRSLTIVRQSDSAARTSLVTLWRLLAFSPRVTLSSEASATPRPPTVSGTTRGRVVLRTRDSAVQRGVLVQSV